MNDLTPLTFGEIKMMLGGGLIAITLFVASLLLKDWVASLVASWRAKKNGGNGKAAIAKNGDIQALINAQNDTKSAVVKGFADLVKAVNAGFDRICGKLDMVKDDTKATRDIVEEKDGDLVPRVWNKPAIEKLIRKIAAKIGIGGIDG